MDFVGRFESLQEDFRRVCANLGIESAELPHRNRSDKKSRDAVADYYRKDIETFEYTFPWYSITSGNGRHL